MRYMLVRRLDRVAARRPPARYQHEAASVGVALFSCSASELCVANTAARHGRHRLPHATVDIGGRHGTSQLADCLLVGQRREGGGGAQRITQPNASGKYQ